MIPIMPNVASSMRLLNLLASFAGPESLILGDMAELVKKPLLTIEPVGEYAKTQKQIDQLYT